MKRAPLPLLALAAVLTALPLTAQEVTAPRQAFSLTQGMGASFGSAIPDRVQWAPDKQHLLRGPVWLDPLTLTEVDPPTSEAAPETGPAPLAKEAHAKLVELLPEAQVPSARPGRGAMSTIPRHAEGNTGFITSGNGACVVAMIDDDLWAYRRGGKPVRLTEGAKPKRQVQVAPDGETASFIEDDNLFLVRTQDGKRFALSRDGGENLFYGELDWVYQEEVYGRFDFQASWWDPTGSYLSYLRIDEEGVPTFTVVDHIPYNLEYDRIKYPKAGNTNPRAQLHVGRARDGKTRPIDLSRYKPEDEILIVRVAWSPDGEELVFQVQNREQTWLDLNFANPTTGKMRTVIHEEPAGEGWVNILGQPRWLSDGTFLWDSERTGYRHVYHYDAKGKLIRPVTSGEWQVTGIMDVDEGRKEMRFTATKDGAIARNDYIVGLDGKNLRRITPGEGSHSLDANADSSLFIDTFSSFTNPGTQQIVNRQGEVVQTIGQAPMPGQAERYGYSMPEHHLVKARDGYELDVVVYKPLEMEPGKAYPIWLETYSGPDAPTVSNRWDSRNWFQFLAQQGVIGFQVNVRSASGRGQKHTMTCYRRLGLQEVEDLDDAVAWLTDHEWADANRVGITGYSYGGFISALALTRGKNFTVGFAGGGVYDWRDYDTIYTERYMATPQNNPEGYKETSVREAAGDLHGYLVIEHGTMDDNVHFQNAIQLALALQEAKKQFVFMPYPSSRHGGASMNQRIQKLELKWQTIKDRLIDGHP